MNEYYIIKIENEKIKIDTLLFLIEIVKENKSKINYIFHYYDNEIIGSVDINELTKIDENNVNDKYQIIMDGDIFNFLNLEEVICFMQTYDPSFIIHYNNKLHLGNLNKEAIKKIIKRRKNEK